MRRRTGHTALEILVASTVLAGLLLIVHQFQSGALRMGAKTADASGALRSVTIASEFLRFDLGRVMIRDEASEIKITEDGRRLELTISDEPDADLTKFTSARVSYYVRPVPGKSDVYQLMREGPDSVRFVEECWLSEFTVNYIQPGVASDHQAYVEISMVGVESPRATESYVSSQLIPVAVPQEPVPYELVPGGGNP